MSEREEEGGREGGREHALTFGTCPFSQFAFFLLRLQPSTNSPGGSAKYEKEKDQ